MKITGYTGNYRTVPLTGNEAVMPYLMADSSILYTGRPFFIPDFAPCFVAVPSIVVRMSRLGKCVAPRFAHRYWDALTAGFSVLACDGANQQPGDVMALDRAFDGAAMVGDWTPVADLQGQATSTLVEFMVNDNVVATASLDDMITNLDTLIGQMSVRCSIKMGDLIFTGECGPRHTLTPGDCLTARVHDRTVLDIKVRL